MKVKYNAVLAGKPGSVWIISFLCSKICISKCSRAFYQKKDAIGAEIFVQNNNRSIDWRDMHAEKAA